MSRLVRDKADLVAVELEDGGFCGGSRDGYVRMTRSKLMYRVVFPFTLKVTPHSAEVAQSHRLPSHVYQTLLSILPRNLVTVSSQYHWLSSSKHARASSQLSTASGKPLMLPEQLSC